MSRASNPLAHSGLRLSRDPVSPSTLHITSTSTILARFCSWVQRVLLIRSIQFVYKIQELSQACTGCKMTEHLYKPQRRPWTRFHCTLVQPYPGNGSAKLLVCSYEQCRCTVHLHCIRSEYTPNTDVEHIPYFIVKV